jgi:hypothetical protein
MDRRCLALHALPCRSSCVLKEGWQKKVALKLARHDERPAVMDNGPMENAPACCKTIMKAHADQDTWEHSVIGWKIGP